MQGEAGQGRLRGIQPDAARMHPAVLLRFEGGPDEAHRCYVCADDTGPADLGNRYIRLADMFSPQGISTNICGPDAMAVALDRIADRLLELTQP
jgi:hypothetical protein